MAWAGNVFSRLYSWVADAAAAPPVDITASRMDADTNDIVAGLAVSMEYVVMALSGAIPPGIGTVLVNAGAAVTLTLSATPYGANPVRIIDISGNASTNNITIIPASGTINGNANYVIDQNYGAVILATNGVNWGIAGAFRQKDFTTLVVSGNVTIGTVSSGDLTVTHQFILGGGAVITGGISTASGVNIFTNLPTSASGLVTGQIWNSSGVVHVV